MRAKVKVKRERLIITPPRPRGVVHAKMCDRCPFKPDGKGYAQDHPDLPNIVRAVELGMPFYCHETVILDSRTTFDAADEPHPVSQQHFELCRGGHERRMKVWREGVIAAGHTPGELK